MCITVLAHSYAGTPSRTMLNVIVFEFFRVKSLLFSWRAIQIVIFCELLNRRKRSK